MDAVLTLMILCSKPFVNVVAVALFGGDRLNILLLRPPRRDFAISACVFLHGASIQAAAARSAGHTVDIPDAYALRWSWSRCGNTLPISAMT